MAGSEGETLNGWLQNYAFDAKMFRLNDMLSLSGGTTIWIFLVAVIVGDSDGGIFSVSISKLYKIFKVSQRHYKAAMYKCSGWL